MSQWPAPRIDEVNEPFWQACNEERLVIQRCQAEGCSRYIYYPRVCCPYCRNGALDWVQVSGQGHVVSHTTIHRPHHEAFDAPYVFAAVQLREGPLVYATLEDAPTGGRAVIGSDVVASFAPCIPGQKLLTFRMAPANG